MLPRQDQPPLGVGESASVPSAAAIANAIFDATGVRFREPPFTPERILRGLRGEQDAATPQALPAPAAPQPSPTSGKIRLPNARGTLATIAAVCAAAIGIGAAVLPWRAIAPIARPDASVYSAATIARGQQLAALGDCAVCHTDDRRRAQRRRPRARDAVRHRSTAPTSRPMSRPASAPGPIPPSSAPCATGIHRDGRQLYPAFPYTHFAKTSDADLQALYAYLMAQPPVRADTPANALAFPFNLRPLLAGWNALFHQTGAFEADPDEIGESGIAAPIWSRASAIAAPAIRRATRSAPNSAERLSRRRLCRGLGGAAADLAFACADPLERGRAVRLFAHRPIPLSRRRRRPDGADREGLAALPDQDIRAMAVYLSSFNDTATDEPAQDALAPNSKLRPHKVTVAASTRRAALSRRLRGLP